MDLLNIIIEQILSPPILFFVVGMFAALSRSDLKIPEGMSVSMLLFLLIAIGLKGGVGIRKVDILDVLAPATAAIFLGVGIVLIGYAILVKLKFDIADAGGIATHYGAVSAATMVAGFAFLNERGVYYEPFIPALYPLMDIPALLIGIFLARFAIAKKKRGIKIKMDTINLFKECILGKSILLLISSMIIGYIAGYCGTKGVMPFFDGMFLGVLCLFMLGMGIDAATRLREWKKVGIRLLVYACIMPPIHGIVGVIIGTIIGMSIGGATMLGIIAGSASYISAPATIKVAIPEANPSLSLISSVAITFPFNIIIGIPLYYKVALMLIG